LLRLPAIVPFLRINLLPAIVPLLRINLLPAIVPLLRINLLPALGPLLRIKMLLALGLLLRINMLPALVPFLKCSCYRPSCPFWFPWFCPFSCSFILQRLYYWKICTATVVLLSSPWPLHCSWSLTCMDSSHICSGVTTMCQHCLYTCLWHLR
jgi:hypothetical protein